MKIGKKQIGPNNKPFIIAEVAQSHDGSLGQAMAFIDIAADCGADAIKFQTHIAEEESTPDEPWRIKFSQQDDTRFEYWKRMSFPKDWWLKLKEQAEEKGLIFLSSPFSPMAVSWLNDIGIEAWKIASGEVFNENLLSHIEATKKPVILSSGLSSFSKSKELIERFESKNIQVSLLHCTTMYPTPPEEVGLNIFKKMRNELYDSIPIGLSDHSGTITPSVIAAYMGASVIEVHLTMHKKMFGPDVSSSLDPKDFLELVKCVHFASKMGQSSVKKSHQLDDLKEIKTTFGRSLVFNKDLLAGQTIKSEDIGYKKPGGGLPYSEKDFFVGKILLQDVPCHEKLTYLHVSDTK